MQKDKTNLLETLSLLPGSEPQAKFSLIQKNLPAKMKINSISLKKQFIRAIPEKKIPWGWGWDQGGGENTFYPYTHRIEFPQTPTTHEIRKVHMPTTHRIKYDKVTCIDTK